MPNLSLEEIEDGFVLRDGLVEIKMTTEELLSLRATMNLALDRKLTTFRTRSGQVHPAWVHPVAKVDLWPDAVGANILQIIQTPSGGRINLEIPLSEADTMTVALPYVLSLIRNPTKQ
jgi:hypothetical protein